MQGSPSSQDFGQAPAPEAMAVSQASPDWTRPSPQVAEQSGSAAAVQPAGQQPSAAPQAVMAVDVQAALQAAAVPLSTVCRQAAGEGGHILGKTHAEDGQVAIEVHDSGPGLSEQARASLFQPTISFKKRGMGLGLSIARKSALLSGGDIVLVKGELGGAGFRVLLPAATNGIQTHPDRG